MELFWFFFVVFFLKGDLTYKTNKQKKASIEITSVSMPIPSMVCSYILTRQATCVGLDLLFQLDLASQPFKICDNIDTVYQYVGLSKRWYNSAQDTCGSNELFTGKNKQLNEREEEE